MGEDCCAIVDMDQQKRKMNTSFFICSNIQKLSRNVATCLLAGRNKITPCGEK